MTRDDIWAYIATIVSDDEAPTPTDLRIYEDWCGVVLGFASAADAAVWAKRLGAEDRVPAVSDDGVTRINTWYRNHLDGVVAGDWSWSLHAYEPITPEQVATAVLLPDLEPVPEFVEGHHVGSRA